MSTALLDINDCGLRLWQDGELLLTSPGYALLEGKNYQFGTPARARSRLQPRKVNHRYWWQLNTAPLQPAFGPVRHSADLVHAHLCAILEQGNHPEELILAVPSSLQKEQLALLLGVVGQCGVRLVGLVDRAVAAAAGAAQAGPLWFLELQLHQAVVSRLEAHQGELRRHSVTAIADSGWLALQDCLINSIATSFVRQTRFDPRRKADSEQALHDQLPQLVVQLAAAGEDVLELSGHRARLDYFSLVESCGAHRQRLVGSLPEDAVPVLLDPMLALLPGLGERLNSACLLPDDAVAQGVGRCQREIRREPGQEAVFITSLPALAESAGADASPQPESVPNLTGQPRTTADSSYHVEYRNGVHILYPGSGEPPRVNGEPVTSAQPLRCGDTVQSSGGPQLMLGEAIPGNGSQT